MPRAPHRRVSFLLHPCRDYGDSRACKATAAKRRESVDPYVSVSLASRSRVRERDDGTRDRPLSVYVAELPAGTYSFGASDGNNFYVIGAVE